MCVNDDNAVVDVDSGKKTDAEGVDDYARGGGPCVIEFVSDEDAGSAGERSTPCSCSCKTDP